MKWSLPISICISSMMFLSACTDTKIKTVTDQSNKSVAMDKGYFTVAEEKITKCTANSNIQAKSGGGAGTYTICTIAGDKNSIEISGITQAKEICVYPAFNSPTNLLAFVDSTGTVYRERMIAPETDKSYDLKLSPPNMTDSNQFNYIMIVDCADDVQMQKCLKPGSGVSCPAYSLGPLP